MLSASPTPQVVAPSAPAGAGITCDAGQTYVMWDLGQQVPNADIDPIYVSVKVSPVVSAGTYTNSALVTSGDESNSDADDVAKRTSSAQVQIVQAEGVQIEKAAQTPYVEINRPEEATKDPLVWRVSFVNVNSQGALSNPDVIDRLPQNGVGDTAFTGSLAFSSASVSGSGAAVWYTKAASPSLDPAAGSNARGGSTVWCDAVGGNPVFRGTGDTATAADCPTSAAQVTGLRFKAGDESTTVSFPSGATLSGEVTMVPTGNNAGDVYSNCVQGRVVGLVSPVGPYCAPESVVSSSIGDTVWFNTNKNGIQDSGEPGVANFPVKLTGTDSDGNAVSLATTTDAHGKYLFAGLQSGHYQVTFDPAGLSASQRFTVKGAGSDDTVDSDGDQTTGQTAMITLGVDAKNLTIDQGIVTQAVVAQHPAVAITKYINGDDANTAPGVKVAAGSTMQVKMVVKNTGDVKLDPVVVTDDKIAAANIRCPKSALDVAESMTCTATYPAPNPGRQHTNTATAVGTAPGGQKVTADDPANAWVKTTLAYTGVEGLPYYLGGGLLAVVAGLVLMGIRRRNRA